MKKGETHSPLCHPGEIHAHATKFRREGHKLHTRAFNSYPQRGDGGENYPEYICQRHAHFSNIGLRAYDLLKEGVTMRTLDECYRGFDRIGPTMSKVLLVTNHLWRPDLGILSGDCEVGDGADAAFVYLFKKCGGGDDARKRKLKTLFDFLNTDAANALEPRLRPMIAWVAKRTRDKFPDIPPNAISDTITIYDLQVQLCEWRKFRKNVDKKRSIKRGKVLGLA